MLLIAQPLHRKGEKCSDRSADLPGGGAHCPNRFFEPRAAGIWLASASTRNGLRLALERPYLPRPGPDIPWLPGAEAPAGCVLFDCVAFPPFGSLLRFGDEDETNEIPSPRVWDPLTDDSPADGIFRFFLLFAFSKES